ncbi:MAG: DoxX family protein [Kangiellaceae bacterium]|nr:DoxX family protein [Kangiellaceae bacterium]
MSTESIAIEADSPGIISFQSALERNAHWLLRIALASVFIFHGAGKLIVLQQSAQMLGLSAEVTLLVGLVEVLAAFALLIGPFTNSTITRLGALAIIPIMIGAIAMVHWGRWSFTPAEGYPMGGMEFQVVLTLIATYLLIRGNK